MDRSTEKRARNRQRLDEIVARYPAVWEKLIAEWNSPGPEDRSWLMYSSNYLFRTQGIRWAMDPLALNSHLPHAPVMDVARDLKDLDFVLLTHGHGDHLDLNLLRLLRDFPIQWVIPEAILPLVQKEVGLPVKQILIPNALKSIDLFGLRITPFDGLHWEHAPGTPEGRRGIPATGYLVEIGGKRWLFPGDTRTYDPASLPDFGAVDVLFAHLWLGRNGALQSNLPLLEQFCRFCLALQPRRIILTHLEELSRNVSNFWDLEHANQVVLSLKEHASFLPIQVACTGDKVLLS